MTAVVLLDAAIVGLVSNPRESAVAKACLSWLDKLVAVRTIVRVSAIADYEVRRELLRAEKARGLARLDELIEIFGYLPISESGLHAAAAFWADARSQGKASAADAALDGDVILAGQAKDAAIEFDLPVIVAPTNGAHLSRYVDAGRWEGIPPGEPAAGSS